MDPTNLAALYNHLPLNPKLTSILDLQLESVSSLIYAANHNYHPTVATGTPTVLKNPLKASPMHEIKNLSKLGDNLEEEHEAQEDAMKTEEGGNTGMSQAWIKLWTWPGLVITEEGGGL